MDYFATTLQPWMTLVIRTMVMELDLPIFLEIPSVCGNGNAHLPLIGCDSIELVLHQQTHDANLCVDNTRY